MSKSYQKKKKHKSQPPPEDLKPIQIDETILSRQHNKQQSHLPPDMMASMNSLIEKFEELGLTDPEEFLLGSDAFDIEEFESRIKEILGSKKIACTPQNLKRYLNYLQKTIQFPCDLTGRENFSWEEEYLFGEGSAKAYERLKKTHPAHTDIFKLVKFSQTLSEIDGILVEVERTSDQKKFTLPLADLAASIPDAPDSPILEDYCIWFINYD